VGKANFRVNIYYIFESSALIRHVLGLPHVAQKPELFKGEWGRKSRSFCRISLKSGTEFDHITADTLHMFKVKRSKGQRSR